MLNWRDPENPLAGGAERVSLGYLRDLVKRGHEVHWLTHSFPGCDQESVIDGIHIHRLGGLVASRFRAISWVRRNGPVDLVIDQHHGIPWFANFWAPHRSVSYIHEVLGPIWKSFYPTPLAQAGMLQERLTLRLYRNHPFWTGCESTRLQLRHSGIREATVIRYGVDLTPLPALPDKPLNHPVRLVMISRLAPNKRVEHGPRILQALLDAGVPGTLTIMGDGDCRAAIEDEITTLGLEKHCRLTGKVSEQDKMQSLADAHILIHTSVREGWGLNVVEANSVGTPAVVYPVPGLVDSTIDGRTGLVSSEETPESLAEAVIHLVSEPELYGRLREEAWRHSQEFLWPSVTAVSTPFLEELAVGRGG